MLISTLMSAFLVAQACTPDAGCVCACARPDSGVHADATGFADAIGSADAVGFADASVDASVADTGVFPDATAPDSGADAGTAIGAFTSFTRQGTLTTPAPVGAGQCAGGTSTPGLVNLSVTVGGVARSALVSIPPRALLGGPMPVVLAFHGHSWQGSAFRSTTNAQTGAVTWTDPQIERTMQLVTTDDTDGAIMVFPNGLAGGPCGSSFGWDLGNAGATRDVAFADAMLTWLTQRYCIDVRRLYIYGRSCGGGQVYEIMARRPTTFAAGLVVNGYRNFGLYVTDPLFPPTNLLVIHGSADPTVPLSFAAAYGSNLPLRNASPGETCTVITQSSGLANNATCTTTQCMRGDTRYCVAPNLGHFPPNPLSTNEGIPWFVGHVRQ